MTFTHLALALLTTLAAALSPLPADVVRQLKEQEAACTSTMLVGNRWDFDQTRTVWPATTTVTSSVDCHGCRSLTTKFWEFGHGPVIVVTSTVTAETPSVTQVYACLKSDAPATASAQTPATTLATAVRA